jgi:hypothetical protein
MLGGLLVACTLNTHGELAENDPSSGGHDASAPLDASGQGGVKPDGANPTGGKAGVAGAAGGASGSSGAGGTGGGTAGAAGATGGAAGQGGGTAGQGGSGGTAGQGGSPCTANQKLCGTCVPLGDPSTGCIASTCAPCVFPQAVADCSNGGDCAIAGCDYKYENCDGDLANGCETWVDTNITHCGWCNHPCTNANGTTLCLASACSPTCNTGWGDCDGAADNGCETDLNIDTANCGACNHGCGAAAACGSGTCVFSCAAPRLDCDGNAANGCEIDPTFDASHCGSCGNGCHSPFNCNQMHCGCGANDANCSSNSPAGTFLCIVLSGADKCQCSSILCEYGQYCNAQGVCSW